MCSSVGSRGWFLFPRVLLALQWYCTGQPGNMSVQCRRALLEKFTCAGRGHLAFKAGRVAQRGMALPEVRLLSSWAGAPLPTRLLQLASSFSSRAAAPGDDYEAVSRASVEEPEKLWAKAARGIEWHKPWAKIMERRDPFSTSWELSPLNQGVTWTGMKKWQKQNHVTVSLSFRSIHFIFFIHQEQLAHPRPTGGYAVMLNWTMAAIYGLKSKEVWWAASDLGWVVGHSYICYGPLLHGNATVLYEGKPVGTPDAGAFFRVLAEHGVVAFFTAPTAIRAIRQQDPEANLGKQYTLKRFRTLFVAGERCDVDTLEWCKKIFKVPVLDHWWQTETGSPITASCIGLGNSLTPPPGQTGKRVPGYNVMILDDNKQPAKAKTLGNIVVKLPLPPGAFLGLWKNEDLYKELYFQKFPGYYDTMDAGYIDEDGYLYVMSRVDDVINVAGHRISAGAIEEAVLSHSAVADCAVVGQEDSLKGHVPLALCVLRNGVNTEEEKLLDEIVKRVRENIGPVAAFRKAVFVKQIPKTRSGKIPRSTLSSLVNGKPYKIGPTIEDPAVFKHVEEILKAKLK
ncbi:acyl-CoA synthetase short-chain family member 3, mitochondrial isoform X4 [Rhineura floridana]|uniref:acyl-CoA synthetase short-chain family member 3, mitochondrial isoform X4 n=2 Tax=Rhineura floridana TaxID=261503 RepID=UPI002AC85AE3|nr:acyl-CoA synthetase short-chain family member 3, mitochondrial isoform X4 [Rhineura floridana]